MSLGFAGSESQSADRRLTLLTRISGNAAIASLRSSRHAALIVLSARTTP